MAGTATVASIRSPASRPTAQGLVELQQLWWP
jgi:hypothetical protein